MTDEEKLILVKLITTNHNTFHDIKQALPMLTEAEIKATYKNPISITKTPDEYAIYKFKDTDTFILTEYGHIILFHYRKEQYQSRLIMISTCASIVAAITGIISLLR